MESSRSPSPAMPTSLSSMSVGELSNWLKDGGMPDKFCEAFSENYIDGEAFISLTEQDIKEIVPPIGLVKRILKLRQNYFPSASPLPSRPTGELDCSSSASPQISNPSTPGSSASKSNRSSLLEIPEHWRPEVKECISNQSLEESARCEIVRTLVSLLFSHYAKPTREQCGALTRQLILKHPFMKDDMGNGYQSWEDKMVEKVRNVIKRDRKWMPGSVPEGTKRSKLSSEVGKKIHCYKGTPLVLS